jgi:hypothetical protein
MRQIVAQTVCRLLSVQRYTLCLDFVHAIDLVTDVPFADPNKAG